ncbi:hypothetical protein KUTeg_013910 [Tegillarca granosa]|uniref:Denticleless protein homolog n=1 Tax=Tegillarca granosa TaxID=220873 RepID=A0ABQ9EV16_TEGGR|nr:hypothetical protein KUTeg_013910 [Tegillarca granosa]
MAIFSTLMRRSNGIRNENRNMEVDDGINNNTCNLIKHISYSTGTQKRFDVSSLLEGFESQSSDEHVIVGEEDGSMVPGLACQFCKCKYIYILALVDENGYTVLYDTNKSGQASVLKVWQAHKNAIFDLAWLGNEEKLLTASGDQCISLWDARTTEKIDVFKGHTSTVRSVAVRQEDDAVFVTGSRDGHIMIWDRRCAKKDGHISPVNIIRNAHKLPTQLGGKIKKKSKLGPTRDSQQSVTAVVFQNDTSLVSAGAVDGCVKVWDIRKNFSNITTDPLPKQSFYYSGTSKKTHGYSSLVLDSSYTRLFASCTDDVIYMYDLTTSSQKPMSYYKGHQNNTFYIKSSISPDDQFLLSGSSDELAYIWEVSLFCNKKSLGLIPLDFYFAATLNNLSLIIDKPNKSPIILKGHRAEVSDVAWSNYDLTKYYKCKIATLSDDNTMRIWKLNRRLSEPNPGEVTGIAERTHREIDKKQYSSPSIQHWLNKSNKVSNNSAISVTNKENTENKAEYNRQSNIENSRRPCKRKLVDDDEVENNPSKRRQILDEFESVVNLTLSPKKSEASPRKCQHLKVVLSPRKLPQEDPVSPKGVASNILNRISCGASPLSQRPLFQNYVQSPTMNLPNLVYNGEINKINIRHRKCDKENSPVKGQKIDWLTKIRMNKEGSGSLKNNTSSPKSKTGSPENSFRKVLFKKNSRSPTRKEGSQSSVESSSQSSQEIEERVKITPVKGMKSLLHYFQHKNSED